MKRLMLMAAVVWLTASMSHAAEQLKIGDTAPPLQIDDWVKGERVQLQALRGRAVAVVEFWATWCGPCKASIPHLTELQRRYASQGLVVVGITAEDKNNQLDKVRSFVLKQGDRMGYTVGFDKGGRTYNAYMKASQRGSIPTAFVIDREGRIVWIGHPVQLDMVLADVLNGTYDLSGAQAVDELLQRMLALESNDKPRSQKKPFPGRSKRDEDKEKGKDEETPEEEKVDPLVVLGTEIDAMLAEHDDNLGAWELKIRLLLTRGRDHRDEALKVAKSAIKQFEEDPIALRALSVNLIDLQAGASFDALALQATRKALKIAPDDRQMQLAHLNALAANRHQAKATRFAADMIESMQDDPAALHEFANTLVNAPQGDQFVDVAVRAVDQAIERDPNNPDHRRLKFRLLLDGGKPVSVCGAASNDYVTEVWNDAHALNSFAYELLSDEETRDRCTAMALQAAERACELTGNGNWSYLDTLALAHFHSGQREEAVANLKKAIELCTDATGKRELEDRLKEFEKD